MTPNVRKEGSLLLALVLIFISTNIAITNTIAQDSLEFLSMDDRLIEAYEYILSRYNPILGLVSESEDRGINAVNGTTVDNTYWIYSDNLWAAEALKPYNLEIAENISETVQSYIEEYGDSMLFEAALGEVIPTTIHAGKNIIAFNGTVNGKWVQILLDRHQPIDNPGIFNDAEEYADLCNYMTINYWVRGDASTSEYWFRKGEELWNYTTNKGFYDKAVYSQESLIQGLYENMKLGLFLLAQRVTRFQSNITKAVEAAAWSYQLENGGIASLSYMNGSVYGTANIETTSALLLAHNYYLIDWIGQSICEAKIEQLEQLIERLRLWLIVLGAATLVLATANIVLLIRWLMKRSQKIKI
jgi:hypothetical protein